MTFVRTLWKKPKKEAVGHAISPCITLTAVLRKMQALPDENTMYAALDLREVVSFQELQVR